MFPLKSKYVNEVEMLWFNVNEWAIWLTPLAVRPQCDKESRHNPFDIFAIGPAKWTAPGGYTNKIFIYFCWQCAQRQRSDRKKLIKS